MEYDIYKIIWYIFTRLSDKIYFFIPETKLKLGLLKMMKPKAHQLCRRREVVWNLWWHPLQNLLLRSPLRRHLSPSQPPLLLLCEYSTVIFDSSIQRNNSTIIIFFEQLRVFESFCFFSKEPPFNNKEPAALIEGEAVVTNGDVDWLYDLDVSRLLVLKRPEEEGPIIRGGQPLALIIHATKASKNGLCFIIYLLLGFLWLFKYISNVYNTNSG